MRADDDSDFLLFTGIASETDHFLVGDARHGWNSDALASYDVERRIAEERWRAVAERASQELIEKYGDAV
jgi:hypothetical protein